MRYSGSAVGSSNDVAAVTDAFTGQPLVVKARDLDSGENGRLYFSMSGSDDDVKRMFTVDEDTGAIRKLGGRFRSRSYSNEYEFLVSNLLSGL